MPAEIVLLPGTEYVPVDDVPRLIAAALHPEPERPALTVSYFTKTGRPGALGEAAHWRALPLDTPERKQLEAVWSDLPPVPDNATLEEVHPYLDAFREKGGGLDWELGICWTNPPLNSSIARHHAEEAHREALSQAVREGGVTPVSLATRIPVGDAFPGTQISVADLRAHVARFQIDVRIKGEGTSDLETLMPMQHAASMLAQELWPDTEAARALALENWMMKHPDQSAPLLSGRPSPKSYLAHARHDAEAEIASAIERLREQGVLPLYSPNTFTPTRDPSGAWVKRGELAALINEGRHLDPKAEVRNPASSSVPSGVFRPVPALRAQEQAILAALRSAGFDPERLPPTPLGRKSKAKHAARIATGYTVDVFDKAWQRLRDEGRIRDAD